MGIINTMKARWKLRQTFFVCSGNTCRSPMAEYMLKSMSLERGLGIAVHSRGIGTTSEFNISKMDGPYATEHACNALLEIYPDSDIKIHVPRPLSYHDVRKASLILTMQERHRDNIIANSLRFYGESVASKVFTLKEYAGFEEKLDIEDPMRMGMTVNGFTCYEKVSDIEVQDVYNSCRDEIKLCLECILDNAMPDVNNLLEARIKRQKQKEIERALTKYKARMEDRDE